MIIYKLLTISDNRGYMKKKYLFICSVLLIVLTGCQNNALKRNVDEEQKIYIHNATKNYAGLIELYKNRLKNQDTIETRYKLAQTYYLSSDYDSAYQILSPVIDKTTDDTIIVLYGRILYKLGKYSNSLNYLDKSLAINPKNGEAYNLKGILQIRLGQYDLASESFNQAKQMFYDENKVNNNLAMLAILSQDYLTAYNYLNILYNKGYRSPVLLHNLLYTLVKLDKDIVASKLCVEHKLSDQPMILIQELKQIQPNESIINFIKLVPNFNEMQKTYEQENHAELNNKEIQTRPLIQQPTINNNKKPTTNENLQNIKPIVSGKVQLSSTASTQTIKSSGNPIVTTEQETTDNDNIVDKEQQQNTRSVQIVQSSEIRPSSNDDETVNNELDTQQAANLILGNHQNFVHAIKEINLR